MSIHVGVGGVVREVTGLPAGSGGVIRQTDLGLCGVSGVMRQFYGVVKSLEISDFWAYADEVTADGDYVQEMYFGRSKTEFAKYATATITSNSIQVKCTYAHKNMLAYLRPSIFVVFENGFRVLLDEALRRLGWTLSWPVKYNFTVSSSSAWANRHIFHVCDAEPAPDGFSGSKSGTITVTEADAVNNSEIGIGGCMTKGSSSSYNTFKFTFSSPALINGVSVPVTVVNDLTD